MLSALSTKESVIAAAAVESSENDNVSPSRSIALSIMELKVRYNQLEARTDTVKPYRNWRGKQTCP